MTNRGTGCLCECSVRALWCWSVSAWDDFSSSAQCVVVVVHVASWVILPAASSLALHHPSLHLVLPPPRWELCNTLRGCQERGTKGKLCVHIYMCVYAWWRGRWMEKEREIRVYLRAKKAARDFAYKPSSSFIHHSHPPSHILRFSLLFYQGRRQGRSSHISWPVIGCHSGAGL